jgi:hypothetical protein
VAARHVVRPCHAERSPLLGSAAKHLSLTEEMPLRCWLLVYAVPAVSIFIARCPSTPALLLNPAVQLLAMSTLDSTTVLSGRSALRLLEIDMLDVVLRPVGVPVQQHAHALVHEPGTSISCAHISGTSSQPNCRAAVAGKALLRSRRGGEDGAGDIFLMNAVEVDHQRQQFARGLQISSRSSVVTVVAPRTPRQALVIVIPPIQQKSEAAFANLARFASCALLCGQQPYFGAGWRLAVAKKRKIIAVEKNKPAPVAERVDRHWRHGARADGCLCLQMLLYCAPCLHRWSQFRLVAGQTGNGPNWCENVSRARWVVNSTVI